MISIKKTLVVALCGCALVSVAKAEEEILNAPIVRDYVASNPGLETIIPLFKQFDTNGDNIIDQMSIGFNVFQTGTTTKLFQTTIKQYKYPTPCLQPVWQDDRGYLQFKLLHNNSLVLIKRNEVSCQQQGAANPSTGYSGNVYVVDLSGPGKNVWAKQFTQKIVVTDVIPDINSNGVDELTVVTSNDNGQVSVYVYDGLTGSPLKTTATYSTK